MKKELIQYLFDASSGDESFQERFHSFLDQIPKPSGASAAPEKEGFFINFFGGMFASLRSTELAEKLGLKDLYFCLVEKKLHIIAETGKEKKKHLFIFSESKDGKSNGELEAEIKNIGKGLSATKVLIGREILEEEGQKWKFKVLVANQKGNDPEINGSFKKVDCKADKNLEESVVELAKEDNNENIDGAKKAVGKTIQEAEKLYSDLKGKNLVQNIGKEAAQHGFISGMLMNFRYRYNLRLYLELLTGRGYSDIVLLVRGEGRSWKAIPVIMELKAKGSVENALVEAESYAKGLRRNKIRILTNAGRAICIGVNLNEQEDTYIISDAPFKIERNKEPVMQSLLDIVCGYGTDKDKKSKVKSLLGELYYTFPPEQYTQDYLSRFLLGQLLLLKKPQKAKDIDMYLFNHSGKDILGGNIKNNLTTYMVVVKGIKNQNRVVIFHMQEAGSKKFEYNKYSFYEEVLDEIGLKVVNNPDLIEVYVNGYKKTGPSQSALSPGSFYLDQDLVEIKNKKRFDYFRDSSSIGREMRSKTEQNKFIGKVEKILLWIKGTLRKKLIEKFKEAIDYQQEELRKRFEEEEKKLRRGVNKFELGEYKNFFDVIKELMCDRDGKPKKAFVSMISNENRLKAFLDGLFTGLSDLDRDRIIAVLTEFQVGEGLRADMMMQVVDINNPNKKKKVEELKQSVSMGFEVKYSTTKKEADRKLQNADGQIEGYARCKNIKSITEGDDVAFIGVSFNQGAGSKDELILLSENLIVAGVPHSSTDVSLRSQMSELSLPSASMQNPQPSTSKRERSYHRG